MTKKKVMRNFFDKKPLFLRKSSTFSEKVRFFPGKVRFFPGRVRFFPGKVRFFSSKSLIFSSKSLIFQQNLYKFDLGFSGVFSVARLGFSIFLEWQHWPERCCFLFSGFCRN